MNDFETTLKKNIRKAVTKAKARGITGMGARNLLMVTTSPGMGFDNAPSGPDAYGFVFTNVLRKMQFKNFEIIPHSEVVRGRAQKKCDECGGRGWVRESDGYGEEDKVPCNSC